MNTTEPITPEPKRESSPARLRANRENAKNSRGPVSEEGKKAPPATPPATASA